ncbi:MAG TPA: 3-oxoacid CoA-transferase subunit A [Dehalococcoidia bacterium]|nr:3-oxoacid CoA-transferase subunit A [Dehalococcoidia bacterium]
MAINKVVPTFDEAVADAQDGSVIHIGGFGGPAECPSYLIAALARKQIRDLTITGNLAGWGVQMISLLRERMAMALPFPEDFFDPGLLVEQGCVRKGILAFPAAPGRVELPFERALREGKVEVELLGQGTLAERIRAARAGIAAFYTPVGPGTIVAEGKEVRDFDGIPHLLERALPADFSIIRAHKADPRGNLVYRGTGRTLNATMAGAARVTIAEVDEVVALGDLDPECIATSGVYVQRIVVRPATPKRWDEAC